MTLHLVDAPSAARERVERMNWRPRNVVWELTLACNLRCAHCGSRAGEARKDELTTAECLRVAGELADLGAEHVTLSGGEPTLRADWEAIARALVDRGVRVNLITNGWTRTTADARALAQRAREAGLSNVGVSLDGLEPVHDLVRGKGTFARTSVTVRELVAAGLQVGVLTTIHRLNLAGLEAIRDYAGELGATLWRAQLGKPMGNLSDRAAWTLAPEDLLTLLPRLAKMKKSPGPAVFVGDSIGYYGPHDKVLRGRGWRGRDECWRGCQAGMQALGIEADGGLKGCLSLQAKPGGCDPFVEANVRDAPLAELWSRPGMFAYNRDFDRASLGGFCASCSHAGLCRGGARCVAAAFTGALAEDPYCYHRVASLARGDWRRDLVQGVAAAAMVVLSVGAVGCGDDAKPAGPADGAVADTAVAADTAPVDTGAPADTGEPVDACCSTDYGLPPDTVEPVDACCSTDYGLPPDTITPDDGGPTDTAGGDAIDCATVCCDCDYGVPPTAEELAACCEVVDPCKDVCCDCDYGTPPPPECCP